MQVTSLKDTLTRKDEEIERLQQVKANLNVAKRGIMYGSPSPRRHSIGASRHSTRLSGARAMRGGEKTPSDMDNCSEYSDKHSESGSHQSMDDLKNKSSSSLFKLSKEDTGQNNVNDDIDLLGFGDADSEERLSDISDSGLSMGTETEGSICSIVEYALFPEAEKEKPTENTQNNITTTDNMLTVNKEK